MTQFVVLKAGGVEAVECVPGNEEAVSQIMDWGLASTAQRTIEERRGEWILRGPDGPVVTVSAEAFAAYFEVVE